MEDFALDDLLETAEAGAVEAGPPLEDPPFDNSAWSWSLEVPEPKKLNLGAPVARQHLLWHESAQNEIYEYLTVFEVVPLIRLSRAHKQFIEKVYRTRQLVLGSTFLWSSLYIRCRWFYAWVLRSLPELERVIFGYEERTIYINSVTLEVLKAIMMCPPRNLRKLVWLHVELPRYVAPKMLFYTTFPSLQTLIWNASGVIAANIECPMLELAILGPYWESMILPANAKYQRVLMDDTPQNMTSDLWNRIFGIKFFLSQSESIDAHYRLLQVLDDLKGRARGDTINDRPIVLYAAVRPLASRDWDHLDDLRSDLGLPEQHKCSSDPCVEWDVSKEWTAARITSVWDKVMTFWHLHAVTVPDDIKPALLLSTVGNEVQNDAPGMLELMKTCSLESICPGLHWLPLLRVEREDKLRNPTIQINQLGIGSIYGRIKDHTRASLEYIKHFEDPIVHISFQYARGQSPYFVDPLRKLLEKNAGTIEHVRAENRTPLEDLKLPKLKTFRTSTCAGSAPLSLLREAKNLRRIEMPVYSWEKLYNELEEGQKGSKRKPLEWPSDSQRIIRDTSPYSSDFLENARTYDMIAKLQIQYFVLTGGMKSTDEIYYFYKVVYTLQKEYNHKLQVICCAVGWWEYPWDYAISEMTRGEVTEETWIDLQTALPMLSEGVEVGDRPSYWRSSSHTDENEFSQEPEVHQGARNRTLIIAGRKPEESGVEEIDNLSPLQRKGLQRWYAQLRSAIPSDLYTFCTKPIKLGRIRITDKWFINALKAHRFDEINNWTRIEYLPIMDFTNVRALC